MRSCGFGLGPSVPDAPPFDRGYLKSAKSPVQTEPEQMRFMKGFIRGVNVSRKGLGLFVNVFVDEVGKIADDLSLSFNITPSSHDSKKERDAWVMHSPKFVQLIHILLFPPLRKLFEWALPWPG